MAGLFGLEQPGRRRGPRVRRGDVRTAILDVLAQAAREEEQLNGYAVIQQIAERSDGAWRPSPGSVYPTVSQLEDEGLVEQTKDRGRRTLALTPDGVRYAEEHAEELAAVWAPFADDVEGAEEERSPYADVRREIGQVLGAVWQIASTGSETQRAACVDILVDARRRLYGVLADGPDPAADDAGM